MNVKVNAVRRGETHVRVVAQWCIVSSCVVLGRMRSGLQDIRSSEFFRAYLSYARNAYFVRVQSQTEIISLVNDNVETEKICRDDT